MSKDEKVDPLKAALDGLLVMAATSTYFNHALAIALIKDGALKAESLDKQLEEAIEAIKKLDSHRNTNEKVIIQLRSMFSEALLNESK